MIVKIGGRYIVIDLKHELAVLNNLRGKATSCPPKNRMKFEILITYRWNKLQTHLAKNPHLVRSAIVRKINKLIQE